MASRKDIVAGGAAVEIRAIDQATKVLRDVSGGFMRTGQEIAAWGVKAVAAAAAATTAIVAMSVVTASWSAAVDDASKRTGVSAEALQGLRYGAEQSGATFDDLVAGLRNMSKVLADDDIAPKLEELGLRLEDLRKLQPEEQLAAIAEGISKIGDASNQIEATMSIFGKGGFALLPFLQEGSKGINQFRADAERLGLVLSGDIVAKFAEYDDTIARITASTQAISSLFAASFLPILQPVADAITGITSAVANWLAKNQEVGMVIATVIAATAALGVGLMALGGILSGPISLMASFATIASGWIAVFGTLSLPLAAVAAAMALVVAAGTALAGVLAATYVSSMDVDAAYKSLSEGADGWYQSSVKLVEYLRDEFAPILTTILDALNESDFETAGKLAMLGLKKAFTEGLWEIRMLVKDQLTSLWVNNNPAIAIPDLAASTLGLKSSGEVTKEVDQFVNRGIFGANEDWKSARDTELDLIDQSINALRTKFAIQKQIKEQTEATNEATKNATDLIEENARAAGERANAQYAAYEAHLRENDRLRAEAQAAQFAQNFQQQEAEQPKTGFEPGQPAETTVGTGASGIAGMVAAPMMGAMQPVVNELSKQLTVQQQIEQNTKNMAPSFGV